MTTLEPLPHDVFVSHISLGFVKFLPHGVLAPDVGLVVGGGHDGGQNDDAHDAVPDLLWQTSLCERGV